MDTVKTCGAQISWWNGEYEDACGLPDWHEPRDIHYDGLTWFDDAMDEVEAETVPASLRRLARQSYCTQAGCDMPARVVMPHTRTPAPIDALLIVDGAVVGLCGRHDDEFWTALAGAEAAWRP